MVTFANRCPMISIHTTLAGGDAMFGGAFDLGKNISIHTTLAGGDSRQIHNSLINILFQSTPPSRVATKEIVKLLPVFIISIHTTLAGGDKLDTTAALPGWISIHTTLAGGDLSSKSSSQYSLIFQSTPPSRVATISSNSFDMSSSISIHTTLAGGDSKNGREIHPFSIPIKA